MNEAEMERLASKPYEQMSEDERYAFMDIPKPELTIAQWFAREKILLHRAQNIQLPAEFAHHMKEEFPRALRLIEFLEERLARINDAVGDLTVSDIMGEILSINMETF